MGRTISALFLIILMLLSGCIDPTDPLGVNDSNEDSSSEEVSEPEPEPEPEP